MPQHLLTAGEFAKLARTTKRTVHFYDEKGLLIPTEITESGYRLYKPMQIIDFQVILLLRNLHFSLHEIKQYLKSKHNLRDIFFDKRSVIEQEIHRLQTQLDSIDRYYHNLTKTGFLVAPVVKTMPTIPIFSIVKKGPYAKIGEYLEELRSYFANFPTDATMLSMFCDAEYNPKNDTLHIGVVKDKNLTLKKSARTAVQEKSIPPIKALCHTHTGTPDLLSMLWFQLEEYAKQNGYRFNDEVGSTHEFYYYNPKQSETGDFVTEMCYPVR
jgi:DNA-binding transcriptional MerR regulator